MRQHGPGRVTLNQSGWASYHAAAYLRGGDMDSMRPEAAPADELPAFHLGWQASLLMGAASLILGLIVAFHPTGSLNVISVLLGILMIFSGIYQLVRALSGSERSRIWPAIAGILFILGGIVLIRHLDVTTALIGLFIGFTWIIQGVASLLAGFAANRVVGRVGWWPIIFGVISLIAGIVVVSVPVASVTTLATFLGIWFAVMGVFQIVDALITRSAAGRAGAGQVNVPGQRPGGAGTGNVTDDAPTAGRFDQRGR
jgi:uncharacterized membrane protein HdeD (DUF308 family)